LKKKILLAVIALIVLCVLGGGGFFGYKWWAGRKAAQAAAQAAVKPAPGQEEEEDEPEAAGGEKEGASGPAVLQLKGLIVNLDSPRKNAWLKCQIDILFRDQELGKLAASEKPTPENSVIRSIVLEALSGKKVEEAEKLYGRFHDLVTGQLPDDTDLSDLGKLAVFSGVKEYPARVKCASLCWHTLKAALDGGNQPVSTE